MWLGVRVHGSVCGSRNILVAANLANPFPTNQSASNPRDRSGRTMYTCTHTSYVYSLPPWEVSRSSFVSPLTLTVTNTHRHTHRDTYTDTLTHSLRPRTVLVDNNQRKFLRW